jgi:hypothetical protein
MPGEPFRKTCALARSDGPAGLLFPAGVYLGLSLSDTPAHV